MEYLLIIHIYLTLSIYSFRCKFLIFLKDMGASTLCGFGQISLKCLWASMKKRKRQIHSHHLKDGKDEIVTLEEWILASPSIDKQSSSNKVYPSLGGLLSYNNSTNNNVEVITYQKNNSYVSEVEGTRDQREDKDSSICRSQSGKLKKKVSFRLPEVVDVFILDP
ncbi:hypothetical protein P3L10_022175 [Capsicum annuum]